MTRKNEQTARTAIFAAVLAFITYDSTVEAISAAGSDYFAHVYDWIPLLMGLRGSDGWMTIPYFLWHLPVIALSSLTPIPVEAAAAYVSCFFVILSFYVIYWMLDRIELYYGLDDRMMLKSFLAFALCMVQPLYMYWFDAYSQYLGQFSINTWHNPTQMCVKPFSLLCFCLVSDILQKIQKPSAPSLFFRIKGSTRKAYIGLAVTLFFSCMAKPTFAEMFIPAVAILMLIEWCRRIFKKDGTARSYFRHCLAMLLAAAPSLACILVQFIAYFIYGSRDGGASSSVILTEWMQVWKLYSDNVAFSILLGMAFPLFILLINGSWFVKNIPGRLALTGYTVGLLEAGFLGEKYRFGDGNFLWPMMSGMTLLWITAAMRFFILERTQQNTRLQRFLLSVAWGIFLLHFLFGFLFLSQ